MFTVCRLLFFHWCERGDSNPHTFRYQILSLARLPIPPLSRWRSHDRIFEAQKKNITQQAIREKGCSWKKTGGPNLHYLKLGGGEGGDEGSGLLLKSDSIA